MPLEQEQEDLFKHRVRLAIPVFLVFVLGIPFFSGFFVVSESSPVEIVRDVVIEVQQILEDAPSEISNHVTLPEEVRGIYWTASTAGSTRAWDLVEYMGNTGLNTVVIDAKMDDGSLAFVPENSNFVTYTMSQPAISDLDGLLTSLHEAGIYRIARVAVMRDGMFAQTHPEFALRSSSGNFWKDNIGSVWVDPSVPEVSDYAVELARELYARGFDEIQFDYVRFASDGAVNQIIYPMYDAHESKFQVMQRFFAVVGGAMKEEGIPVSFDLFGMTFWSHSDYNIGQRLVDVFPYTDWVSPMVYPSHYPDGFQGFTNPAAYPYEIVKQSLDKGTGNMIGLWSGSEANLRAKWRPWLQDFDIGAVYTADLIKAQIQAARDAGAGGWILWNARNVYEPADYFLGN